MSDDLCYCCSGTGQWCGQHACDDGCDCEDDAPRFQCPDCGGTGQSNDGDEEDEEA
jgi:hypothetical protein